MSKTIAVVAPGNMGAAVGARLVGRGACVITSLVGRSKASMARARAAGMKPASDEELAAADIFLSIVPPDQAAALAARMAACCTASGSKTVFIDLNAISPATAGEVGGILKASGAVFVDGGIIGPPPKGESAGPTFYLSGPVDGSVEILTRYGLTARALEGGIGAASALKMSYAGVTKGLIALGAGMILAAERAGVDGALRTELGVSQPDLLARLSRSIPDMLPKAYRWVPEMQEISNFVGTDRPESGVYQAMADFYRLIANDQERERAPASILKRFFKI